MVYTAVEGYDDYIDGTELLMTRGKQLADEFDRVFRDTIQKLNDVKFDLPEEGEYV